MRESVLHRVKPQAAIFSFCYQVLSFSHQSVPVYKLRRQLPSGLECLHSPFARILFRHFNSTPQGPVAHSALLSSPARRLREEGTITPLGRRPGPRLNRSEKGEGEEEEEAVKRSSEEAEDGREERRRSLQEGKEVADGEVESRAVVGEISLEQQRSAREPDMGIEEHDDHHRLSALSSSPAAGAPSAPTSPTASCPSSSSTSSFEEVADSPAQSASLLLALVDVLLSCVFLPYAALLCSPPETPCTVAGHRLWPVSWTLPCHSQHTAPTTRPTKCPADLSGSLPRVLRHPKSPVPPFSCSGCQPSGPERLAVEDEVGTRQVPVVSNAAHRADSKTSAGRRASSSSTPFMSSAFAHPQLSRLDWFSSLDGSSSSTPSASPSSGSAVPTSFATTRMPAESLHSLSSSPPPATQPSQETGSCGDTGNPFSSPLFPPSSSSPAVLPDRAGSNSSLSSTRPVPVNQVTAGSRLSSAGAHDSKLSCGTREPTLPQRGQEPLVRRTSSSSSSFGCCVSTSPHPPLSSPTNCQGTQLLLLETHCTLLGKALLGVAKQRKGRDWESVNDRQLEEEAPEASAASHEGENRRSSAVPRTQWKAGSHGDTRNARRGGGGEGRRFAESGASGEVLRERDAQESRDQKETDLHLFAVFLASAVCSQVGSMVTRAWMETQTDGEREEVKVMTRAEERQKLDAKVRRTEELSTAGRGQSIVLF